MKKKKKRLIIILSIILTLNVALVLFCAITGLNLKTLLLGSKPTGSDVVEDTSLKTTLLPLPTDGSTPENYSAADNFAMLSYKIQYDSYFESTVSGVAKANYNGMNVNQGVDDYRIVTPDYQFVETKSSSTFVKVYAEQFYTPDKVLLREGDSSNYDKFDVEARSLKQQLNVYGYGPSSLVGYIVCAETITNTPEVVKNEDGTYTSIYELDPTVAPFYYQRKVKYNAGIGDYPKFESIKLTVKYNDKWEVISINYDEVYSIYKMKSWIKTTNVIEETFTYLDKSVTVPKYDFYKNYFDMPVPSDDELDMDEKPYEMTALDYIGTMANLITGKYMSLDLALDIDGKKVDAKATVNLITLDTQIQIENTYYVYKDNRLYIKSFDNNDYLELSEIKPIIEFVIGLKNLGNKTEYNPSETNDFNIDDMISVIMSDINNGRVTKGDGETTVDVDLHLLSLELPVYFNFNTPNEDTIEFNKLGTYYVINGKKISLDIAISTEDRTLVEIDDSFQKADFAAEINVNACVSYNDKVYDVSGNIYANLLDMSLEANLLLSNGNDIISLNATLIGENIYIKLNGIKFKTTVSEIMALFANVKIKGNNNTLDINLIKSYLNKLSFSLSGEGLVVDYNENLVFGNIVISNISLFANKASYKTLTIDGENYIELSNVLEIVEFYQGFDYNNAKIELSLRGIYDTYSFTVLGNVYLNNNYFDFDIEIKDKKVNLKFYENSIYFAYNDQKYYFSIDEVLPFVNDINIDLIPNNNVDINQIIAIAFNILSELNIINNNGVLEINYKDIMASIDVVENSLLINVVNAAYASFTLENLNVVVTSDEAIVEPNVEGYSRLSTISKVNASLTVLYKGQAIDVSLDGYVNLLAKEGYMNISLSLDNKVVNINLVYVNEVCYLTIGNTYFKATLEDIMALIPQNSNTNSNTNVDLAIVLDILKNITITSENGVNITIDNIDLGTVALENISLNVCSATEEVVSVSDNEYIDINDILEIVDIILNNKDNLKIDINTNISYLYNGELIEANIVGSLYSENADIKAILDITLNDISVNVAYLNNYLYLSYKNMNIKLSVNEFMNLGNNKGILLNKKLDIIPMAFDLLNKLTITSYEGFNISIVELISGLSDINLKIINNTDSINLVLTSLTYKDLKVESLNVVVNTMYEELVFDDSKYLELTTTLNVGISTKVKYENIVLDIVGEIYLDLNTLNIEFNGKVVYDGKEVSLYVVYIDEVVYIDFTGIKLYYEMNNIPKINTSGNMPSLGILSSLSFDKNIEIITTDVLSIVLGNFNIRGISIENTIIEIGNTSTKDVIINKEEYTNDINNLINVITDLIDNVDTILTNKKFKANVSFTYNNILVNGIINVDFASDIMASANLEITYNGSIYNVNIKYINDYVYLSYNTINVKLNIAEVMGLLASTNNNSISKINFNDIYNKVDIAKMLIALTSASNELSIELNLSDFVSTFTSVIINLIIDDNINISSNKYSISAVISDFIEPITVIDSDYVDLSGLIDSAKVIYDLISLKKLSIDLNAVSVNMNGTKIDLIGSVDVDFSDGVKVLADLVVSVKGVDANVKVLLIDNMLYVTTSMQTLVINIDELGTFVNALTAKINEIFGTDVSTATTLNVESKNYIIDDIISVINSLIISENSISMSLDSLINAILNISIAYATINNNVDLTVNGNYEDITFSANMLVKEASSVEFIVPTINLISTDDLLICLDYVKALYELKDKKEFNLAISTSIVKNGKVVADITGNVMVLLHSGKEFDLFADLIIIEYKNGVKCAWHTVEATIISSTTSGSEPMFYATYGNREEDPSSLVKVYANYNNLIDLAKTAMKFPSIFAGVSTDAKSSSSIDINKLISSVLISDTSVCLGINQLAFNKLMENDEILDISLSMNGGKISSIELNNLFVSYTNEREYMKLINTDLYITDNPISIVAPSSLDGYYDLTNINYLADSLYNTASQKDYEITGTIKLGLPVLSDVNVPVTIKVNVFDDGSFKANIHLDVPKVSVIVELLSKKSVDIMIYKGYVYIHRVDKNGSERMIKIHYKTFMDDILYYLLDYSLGLPDVVLDQIVNAESNGKGYVDAGKCVTNVSLSETSYTFGLNLGEVADNPTLGALDVTLGTSKVYINDSNTNVCEDVNAITSINNLKMSMVKSLGSWLITLSATNLSISNIETQEIDGVSHRVFTSVDMSSSDEFVNNFDASYNADEYYSKSSGGVVVSEGKLSHAVVFNFGDYIPSKVVYYTEGSEISFPSYTDNVVLVESDGISKYYKILGWYYDKSYQKPVTNLEVMANRKLYYYAKMKDVTTNITIKSDYHEDLVITSYEGASIENIVASNYGVVTIEGKVYKFNGLELNGEVFDMTSLTKGSFELNAIYEEVNYPFVVIYGENEYTLDTIVDEVVLPNDAAYSINGVTYLYSKDFLTTNLLLSKFSKYFEINEDKERFELELIDPSYELDSFVAEDYNLITYNVNEKFDSFDYYGFYLPKTIYDITSLIPNTIIDSYVINAWNDNGTYYNISQLKSINSSMNLTAYISTNPSEFGFEVLSEENKTAALVNYSGTASNVILPRYVSINGSYYVLESLKENISNGQTVSAFTANETIVNVVFNDGFKTIGANAFKNCKNIRNIYFSDSVSSVATDAFYMDYSGTIETVRDTTIKHVRFYMSSNSTLSSPSWLAGKASTGSINYGNRKLLGFAIVDLRDAFQNFDGDVINIASTLV